VVVDLDVLFLSDLLVAEDEVEDADADGDAIDVIGAALFTVFGFFAFSCWRVIGALFFPMTD
jgi:hypothetical protein